MTTATERPELGIPVHDDRSSALGPVLVATDGTESSGAALRAAATVARDAGAAVTVLAVMEGVPLVAADYGILIPPIDASPVHHRWHRRRRQLEIGSDAIVRPTTNRSNSCRV